jgi:hypothetical protein
MNRFAGQDSGPKPVTMNFMANRCLLVAGRAGDASP